MAHRLRLLEGVPDEARAAILLAAAPHAGSDELPEIAQAMLFTGRAEAVTWLLANLRALGDDGLILLRSFQGDFGPGMGRAIASHDEDVLLNVIQVIALRQDAANAYHLVDLLHHHKPLIVDAAAQALVSVAVHHLQPGQSESGQFDEPSAARIRESARRVISDFERHRCKDALVAGTIAAERPGDGQPWPGEPDEIVAMALRGVASRTQLATVRRNLLRWATLEQIAAAAAAAIADVAGTSNAGDLLGDGHLIRSPARRAALRRLPRSRRSTVPIAAAVAIPSSTQRFAPLLTAALDLPQEQKVEYFCDAVALPDPTARLLTLRMLMTHETAAAGAAVAMLAQDRNPHVARIAARRGAAADLFDSEALERLAQSPHTAVAAMSRRTLVRRSSSAFCARWLTIDEPWRVLAARKHLAADRVAMRAWLRHTMQEGQPGAAVAAVGLVRRVGLVGELQQELIALVRQSHAKVAASAVAALAAAPPEAALGVLRVAMEHQDDRVRANAVEAIARSSGGRAIGLVEPALAAGDHRARANAIVAFVRHQPHRGLRELRGMLEDRQPIHRVSAIWAARRSMAVSAVEELARLVRADPVPEIRTRAEAARRLLSRAPKPPAARSGAS